MKNPIAELNNTSVDSYITRYMDVLEECIQGFNIITIPEIKEEFFSFNDIEHECSEYLKTHTEFALKLTLDTITEFMKKGKKCPFRSGREKAPVFLKGESAYSYFVYSYMKQRYLIRKFVPDDFYVSVTERMKDLCLKYSNTPAFFTDGRTNETEFILSEVNESSKDNMADAFSCSCDSNLFSVIDRLFAENKDAVIDTDCDNSDSRKNDEESEDIQLVQKASELGVMPWELLPLKDEYRNIPFSQWDVKPVLPVINYFPYLDIEEYEFKSYGLRDGIFLAEDAYADFYGLDSFSLDLYSEPSDQYISELLKAMIAGRKSMEEADFHEYLKKMIKLKASEERKIEKIRQEYIEDGDKNLFEGYLEDIRESIVAFPEEDDEYIGTLSDKELENYVRRKFLIERNKKRLKVKLFIDWNRKRVYPKILVKNKNGKRNARKSQQQS